MEKNEIMHRLHEKDFMRKIHGQLVNGLVGCMANDYRSSGWAAETSTALLTNSTLRAVVDMTANFLLHHVAEDLVEEVLNVIEEGERDV